jgi:hypothetical protein
MNIGIRHPIRKRKQPSQAGKRLAKFRIKRELSLRDVEQLSIEYARERKDETFILPSTRLHDIEHGVQFPISTDSSLCLTFIKFL